MASNHPRTRSQAAVQAGDTEDEEDYTSANEGDIEEDPLDETTLFVPQGDPDPGLKTLAQVMLELRLNQAKQAKEQAKRDQEHKMEMERQAQEMARRDQEHREREQLHREQMTLLMETISNLQRREERHQKTKAKHAEMPKLGPFQDMKISTFQTWRESFEGYSTLIKADSECDHKARRHLIRSAIDASWQELWTNGGLKVAIEDDMKEIMDKMYAYLRKKRSPLLDRKLFHKRDQYSGEKIDEYQNKLETLLSQCDYGDPKCPGCGEIYIFPNGHQLREEMLRDRIVFGVNSREMQEKLLEKPFESLTLNETIKVIQATEASKSGSGEINEDLEVNNLNQSKQSRRYKQKSAYKKQKESYTKSDNCKKCGMNHEDKCPAEDSSCNYCKKKGHWDKVCLAKKHKDTMHTSTIYLERITLDQVEETPVVSLKTSTGTKRTNLKWLLDTGAQGSVIGMNYLKKLGNPKLEKVHCKVRVADGKEIEVKGKVTVTLEHEGLKEEMDILVISEARYGLLGLPGIKALKFLPEKWPKREVKVDTITLHKNPKQRIKLREKEKDNEPRDKLDNRPLRTKLHKNLQANMLILRKRRIEADEKASEMRERAKERYDNRSKGISKLKIGSVVKVQHRTTKKWNLIGEIMEIAPRERSYLVKAKTGKLYWRSKRFLRPHEEGARAEKYKRGECTKSHETQDKATPKRGTRQESGKKRFLQTLNRSKAEEGGMSDGDIKTNIDGHI